jgi:hypothetical protein
MSVNRAGDWLKQAENDLLWAGDTQQINGFFNE